MTAPRTSARAVMQPAEFPQQGRARLRLVARLADRRQRPRQRIVLLPGTTTVTVAAVPAVPAVVFAGR
ncbi:MAG: hypothetical protein GEU81_09445 [Nitriliruptorales bacterium]|nr:hypothetical protein [Nitriliruptorales bacterium]